MEDLPNGFITRPRKTPGFESAGDAIRRSRAGVEPPKSHEFYEQADQEALEKGWSAGNAPAFDRSFERDVNRNTSYDVYPYLVVPESPSPDAEVGFNLKELDSIPVTDRRWSWVEVELSAITNNVLAIRQSINPDTLFMAVVKANAYGHGAVESTKAAIAGGAAYAGVATIDEAVELRRGGIDIPILILSEPPISAIPFLLAYDVMPAVSTMEFAVKYAEAADSIGVKAPFHLKINTGMNRIGVRYNEVKTFIRTISFHRALLIAGTFTHFATADTDDTMDFKLQKQRFEAAVSDIRSLGFDPGIIHAANSAATLRYKDVQYDMVRPGIAMYGCYPSPACYGRVNLMPAMSVKARITQVNQVPVGEGVSYGLLHRCNGFAKTCTLPIGYGDGLKRGLSGRINVLMNGRKYPQVGNICMDQCMFEIDQRTHSGIGRIDPKVGDEVTIVGTDGNAFATVDQMAELIHSIPYEILIGFGDSRLPKVFV